MVPKNVPEDIIKTVTDPDPGPCFISFYYKMEKEWRSVFQDPDTPLLRTLKQSPTLGLFKGGVKTEGKPGSGQARGQAQWSRQLGSPFLRCRLCNPLPNTGWSSSFGIQTPGQRCRIVADSVKRSLKWTVFTNISYTIIVIVLVRNDQRNCC